MKLYKYDERTKEYLWYFKAYEDELETMIQKKPVYVIPPCSTKLEPMKPKEGYVVIFNGTNWEEIEDNRGLKFFNKDGEEVEITELGPIPKDYTTEKVLSFKEVKDLKFKEITDLYKEAVEAIVKVGKMEVKQDDSPYIYVTLDSFGEDCTKLNFRGEIRTRKELERAYKYLYARSLLLAKRKSDLTSKVQSAKKKEQVDSIKVDFDTKKEIKELLPLTIEEISERF